MSLLDAGAILPGAVGRSDEASPASAGAGMGETTDPGVDAVTARAYRHPALGRRDVVRLVGATVGPAEDLSMEFLGFVPVGSVTVGHARRRALGFAAWALVHDPAHGRHALALVKDMERLARTARDKPGNARDGYTALAVRLGRAAPRLLPVFWEQAGRAFLAADNPRAAGTCFAEARRAEQVHGLAIDEDRVRDVHLEFALAGGLPAATLNTYAREVASRRPPEEAYTLVRSLILRRVAGGQPPHAALVTDLARLAKAAGLDPEREVDDAVTLLLGYPATRRSNPAVWKSLRTSLVRLGKRDAAVRARLLAILPNPPGWRTDLRDQWLELLGATGAADDLCSGAGDWLWRLLETYRLASSGRRRNVRLIALVERLAPHLIAAGGVRLADEPTRADLDLLDVCVAAGVPVDIGPVTEDRWLDVAGWLHDDGDGRRDLMAIAADPELRPLLREGLRRVLHRFRVDKRIVTGTMLDTPGLRDVALDLVWTEAAENIPAELADLVDPGPPRERTPHVSDDALAAAVEGLSGWDRTERGDAAHLLTQVVALGAVLADPDAPEPPVVPPVGPVWAPLLAGLGAVALRAASPATPDADRAALVALLTAVAGTPLDGGGTPIRVLEVLQPDMITSPVKGYRDGGRITVLFPGHSYHYEQAGWLRGVIQSAPDGEFTPLADVANATVRQELRPSGRLAGERLRTFLSLLAERGPAPWRPEAAEALAAATGMTRAEAILLLAGLPGPAYQPVSAERRTLLGLTAPHAKAARAGLAGLSGPDRVALLDAAMPADPAALWEHGPDVPAIAERWIALRGRRAALPDDLVTELGRLIDRSMAAKMLRAITAPHTGDWLTTDGVFDGQHLIAAATALPWLAYRLTWDDPLRATLPRALELIRERLRYPELRVGEAWYRLEDRPDAGPALADEYSHDTHVRVALVPAHLTGPDDPAIDLVDDDTAFALRFLLSRLADNAMTTPAGATGDPRDPRVSHPALVREVQERHGLDADTAAYYLQLLALPDPTDRNVQGYNGWKTAGLRAAQRTLTEAGLVIAAKRERAGRPVFLPGDWQTARSPRLPVERWKTRLMAERGGAQLVLVSLPDLFRLAWTRVLDGDQPRPQEPEEPR